MLQIKKFTFNPFSENTYVIWDDTTLDAAIVDPGCMDFSEMSLLDEFISMYQLQPCLLLNTHCHIDHVLGNNHIASKYNLPLNAHELEVSVLQWSQSAAILYQLPYDPSPDITVFIKEGQLIKVGNETLELRFTPGHSPGSITFINHASSFALVGDVIFRESIGRTDLPGGDFDVLAESIRSQIYSLPNNYMLYSGHGPVTTVGYEKQNNAFVKQQ